MGRAHAAISVVVCCLHMSHRLTLSLPLDTPAHHHFLFTAKRMPLMPRRDSAAPYTMHVYPLGHTNRSEGGANVHEAQNRPCCCGTLTSNKILKSPRLLTVTYPLVEHFAGQRDPLRCPYPQEGVRPPSMSLFVCVHCVALRRHPRPFRQTTATSRYGTWKPRPGFACPIHPVPRPLPVATASHTHVCGASVSIPIWDLVPACRSHSTTLDAMDANLFASCVPTMVALVLHWEVQKSQNNNQLTPSWFVHLSACSSAPLDLSQA